MASHEKIEGDQAFCWSLLLANIGEQVPAIQRAERQRSRGKHYITLQHKCTVYSLYRE